MSRDIVWTNQFKKDYKRALKHRKKIELLDDLIRALARGEILPEKYKDHALTGQWEGHHKYHVQSGWLLFYYIEGNTLTLTRIGDYHDLFGI